MSGPGTVSAYLERPSVRGHTDVPGNRKRGARRREFGRHQPSDLKEPNGAGLEDGEENSEEETWMKGSRCVILRSGSRQRAGKAADCPAVPGEPIGVSPRTRLTSSAESIWQPSGS